MSYPWTPRIQVDTLAGWFDECREALQETFGLFNIQKADGNLVTIKDRFKAKFDGFECRYTVDKLKVANTRFHEIIENNKYILMQIEKYEGGDLLKELGDFNLYQDEQITDYTNDSSNTSNSTGTNNTTTAIKRNLIDGSLSGTADMATLSTIRDESRKVVESKKIIEKSQNKILDYLEPTTKGITHTINVWGGGEDTSVGSNSVTNASGRGNMKGHSKSSISNPYKDRITFLNMHVFSPCDKFLEKFRVLFLC